MAAAPTGADRAGEGVPGADLRARLSDAVEVASRVKRYRDEIVARQAEAERLSWIRALAEAFPPAAEDARARLRQQIRALLRAEVAAQAQRLSGASPAEAAAARQVLECLRGLPVLAGVHDLAALADLPEPERQAWQAFWQEVEGLLAARTRRDDRLPGLGAAIEGNLPC